MKPQVIQGSPLQLTPYAEDNASQWESFLQNCPMATFMHTRQFMAYHGKRFQDQSLLLQEENKALVAVFPAAVNPQNAEEIISHPGLSFGGLLHPNSLQGERMVQALLQIKQYYRQLGFKSLKYKAIPAIYHRVPAQDDLYGLFRLDAIRYRCDLASTIDVTCRPSKNQKRKWELKQAEKYGIEVVEGPEYAEALWDILQDNLSRKHQATPVHTLEEIRILHQRFSHSVHFVVGLHHKTVVAGLVLFSSPNVVHVQYMASSVGGNGLFALHPVIEHCIEKTKNLQARYFDFGISNEQDGHYLNQGLHLFKSKFGASGTLQEFYQIDL